VVGGGYRVFVEWLEVVIVCWKWLEVVIVCWKSDGGGYRVFRGGYRVCL